MWGFLLFLWKDKNVKTMGAIGAKEETVSTPAIIGSSSIHKLQMLKGMDAPMQSTPKTMNRNQASECFLVNKENKKKNIPRQVNPNFIK